MASITTWLKRWRRLFANRCADAGDIRTRLPQAALDRLAARVAASEQQHAGEIRICIEAGLPWSYIRHDATARDRALTLFGKLRVWDTEHNNGVLIYLCLLYTSTPAPSPDRRVTFYSLAVPANAYAASIIDRPITSRWMSDAPS